MNRHYINYFLIIALPFLLFSCLPDRMPTEPTEIERPLFAVFDLGESKLNVDLNRTIQIYFNETMDLNSFPEHFKVEGISGEIKGNFSYGNADTIVVFTPVSSYQPSEYYEITLTGGIRDANGNSLVSPIEEDVPQKDWFFTSGEYSNNGFPYIFIRDKSNRNFLYRVGNLNIFKDNLELPGTVDYQTSALEIDPISDKLFVVNLKTTEGLVSIIDPSTFTLNSQLTVGLGPTNIEFGNQKAYVTNLSAKSFSVIDLNSLTVETEYIFPDGFRPKDVAYSSLKNALYFYTSVNPNLKMVNAGNFEDSRIFSSGLSNNPTDIEITRDGKFLFMIGTNSNILSVVDLESETANPLTLDYQYLTDGVMGNNYYYVAYYRGTGGEDIGGILKIDINTKEISGHLEWGYQVDQLKLTASEELLYAVTPIDSTVQVIETKSMHKITEAKVEGSLKFLAITNKNY